MLKVLTIQRKVWMQHSFCRILLSELSWKDMVVDAYSRDFCVSLLFLFIFSFIFPWRDWCLFQICECKLLWSAGMIALSIFAHKQLVPSWLCKLPQTNIFRVTNTRSMEDVISCSYLFCPCGILYETATGTTACLWRSTWLNGWTPSHCHRSSRRCTDWLQSDQCAYSLPPSPEPSLPLSGRSPGHAHR